MKKSVLILFLLNSVVLSSQAQLNATVYEDFTQTVLNPYIINPAASDTSYHFRACFNNVSELQLVEGVSQFYLDIDKKVIPSQQNGLHFIGLQMTSSNLGEYISRNRMRVRYSWYLPVGPKEALTAGASVGFINYAFLTTQGGGGGSDFSPDGEFGIHYLSNRTTIGLAIQQIFSPVLIPVNQSFKLDRLYNLDLAHDFFISPQCSVQPQFVFQLTESMDYTYGINLITRFFDYGLIGISNFYLRKTSAMLGVERLNVLNAQCSLIFTYSNFHSDIPYRNGLLEIFLAFQK